MKYLGIHKLVMLLILLIYLLIEIVLVSLWYIFYVIWNLKIPHKNLWFEFHNVISDFEHGLIEDYNPKETFIRRYKYIFS